MYNYISDFFKPLAKTIRQKQLFFIKIKNLEAKGNFYWPFLVLVCKRFFQIIINDLTLFTTNIITYVAYCCRASFFNEEMKRTATMILITFRQVFMAKNNGHIHNWYFYYHNCLLLLLPIAEKIIISNCKYNIVENLVLLFCVLHCSNDILAINFMFQNGCILFSNF